MKYNYCEGIIAQLFSLYGLRATDLGRHIYMSISEIFIQKSSNMQAARCLFSPGAYWLLPGAYLLPGASRPAGSTVQFFVSRVASHSSFLTWRALHKIYGLFLRPYFASV